VGIFSPQQFGIFELTRLNKKTGLYMNMNHLCTLKKLFEPQCKRASIDKIMILIKYENIY